MHQFHSHSRQLHASYLLFLAMIMLPANDIHRMPKG